MNDQKLRIRLHPHHIEDWGRAFLNWWKAELVAMLPLSVRRLLPTAHPRLYVRADGAQAHVFLVEGEEVTKHISTAWGVDELRTAAHDIAGGDTNILSRTILRIGEDSVLVHPLRLPRMSRRDLKDAITLQAERLSPVPAQDIIFAFHAQPATDISGQLNVTLAISLHDNLSVSSETLTQAGMGVMYTEVEDADACPLPGIRLYSTPANTTNPAHTRMSWGGATLAATLAIMALYLPLQKRHDLIDQLFVTQNQARAQALDAANVSEEIERLNTNARFLNDKYEESVKALNVLNELSKAIPDDSWMVEFHLLSDSVSANGFTKSSSALVPAISRSALFATPTFDAPVTTDEAKGLERFSLSIPFAREDGS